MNKSLNDELIERLDKILERIDVILKEDEEETE